MATFRVTLDRISVDVEADAYNTSYQMQHLNLYKITGETQEVSEYRYTIHHWFRADEPIYEIKYYDVQVTVATFKHWDSCVRVE